MSKKKMVSPLDIQDDVVMVCVTSQRQCETLIGEGARMAQMAGARLTVVSVQPPRMMDPADGELLEYLMQVARECSGDLLVLYDSEPAPRLIEYARDHRAKAIILGRAPDGGPSAVVSALTTALPGVRIVQPPRHAGTVEALRMKGAM